MASDSGRGAKIFALACVAVLTAVLVVSVRRQSLASTAASSREAEMQVRCREHLSAAVEEARARGDVELAEWLEALPMLRPTQAAASR